MWEIQFLKSLTQFVSSLHKEYFSLPTQPPIFCERSVARTESFKEKQSQNSEIDKIANIVCLFLISCKTRIVRNFGHCIWCNPKPKKMDAYKNIDTGIPENQSDKNDK